jgi:hypothetical protein
MRSRWWALSSCEEWSRARRVPSRDAAVVDRSQEKCVFSNRIEIDLNSCTRLHVEHGHRCY